jgi:hypothetical protein
MYAIIVGFALAAIGAHGEGASDERYASLDECNKARPAVVESIRAALQAQHGRKITITDSHCGLASEIGATPA